MVDFCIYLLYRAGSALLRLLPLRFVFALGQCLGVGAWLVLGRYRRLAHRNVAIAFGSEKSAAAARRLVRHHFQTLSANLLAGVKLGSMPLKDVVRRIEIENLEEAQRLLREGRPVVFVLSHLSNWELLAQIFPHYISCVRNGTVFQKLGNPYIDAHVRRTRGRHGVELFDRSEGFHGAIELLRGGGALGILSDQHAGDHGLWTPFFSRLASTSPLPALLAKRAGAALIAATIYTNGPARWRFVFSPRLDHPGDSVAVLTARTNDAIAEEIRAAPEDWFWVHNRWKTPLPHFLLSRYKRGHFIPPAMPPESLQPFRILIRAPNWLGDSIMSVPAVRAIKAGRADAHLTVAAPEKSAPMWKLVAEVDKVLAIPERSLFATVRLLRKERSFEVAILFPNSLRSALEAWLARIPRRAGYRGHGRSWLINQVIGQRLKPGPPAHHAQRYLRIAKEIGAAMPAGSEVSFLNTWPVAPNGKIRIGLSPGAEYGPAKRWLPERFAEAAMAISDEHQVEWLLFGTTSDVEVGKTIAGALGDRCINRIGQTSLAQLIDELRECRLLLTNDTGSMHLAALLGIPVVAIFGSTEPALTGPLGSGHTILRHHVECSPCFLRECPLDFRCMKAVTTEEVTKAILAGLDAS